MKRVRLWLCPLLIATGALLFAVSCSHEYTQEEMAGVFTSEATPTVTVHLNADGSSLTDFGGGTTFRGRWNRIPGRDGIHVGTDAGGDMYYQIESKDRIKWLMTPEDIQLVGQDPKPFYNRVR